MKLAALILSISLINPLSAIAYTREAETYGRCVSQETGQIVRCTETCTMDDGNGRRREIPCKDECYELDEKGNPELDRNGRKIYFPCPPRQ